MAANQLDFDPNQLSQEGLNLLNAGDFKRSIEIFDKLNTHFPNNPDLLNLIAFANLQLDIFDSSLEAYSRSIKINPNQVGALFNRAIVHEKLGNQIQALNDYDAALKLDPNNLDIYINKSAILEDLGEFNDALININKVIEFSPNNFMALSNRGKILQSLFEYKKAIIDFDGAIKIAPNNSYLYVNRGNFFKKIGKFKEAKKDYFKAIKLDKNSDYANYNLALLLLYEKDFQNGWIHYESRFFKTKIPKFCSKINELQSFESKEKILIWADQGIGDQIFFASIIQNLENFKNITVMVDPRLINIFKRSFKNINFIPNFDSDHELDYTKQLSLISLGKFFRNSIDSFKKIKSPYLYGCKELSSSTLRKIKNQNKLICGISWRSNNKLSGQIRSVNLEQLLPILKIDKIHFVDLQYDNTIDDLKNIKKNHEINIDSLNGLDKFNDIEGVFALINCCDFILTIDNSIAHFSGALGKKTFLMLPHMDDSVWYWHNDTESMWYPSIEIYRQDKANDWASPINNIAKRIKKISYKIEISKN